MTTEDRPSGTDPFARIDAELTTARRRWQAAQWTGDLPELGMATRTIDELLEQREIVTRLRSRAARSGEPT